MRTRITLDEKLLRRAARLTSLRTPQEIVQAGLELLVRVSEQEIRRSRHGPPRASVSCAELAGELMGSMRGPRDASTNKKRLAQAMLADHRKPAAPRR